MRTPGAHARARATTTQSFTDSIIILGRAGAAAFFGTTNRGKLLQHKLIRVQCAKKVPEYRYPLYRSTGIRFKQVILKGFLRLDLQPVQLICCGRVFASWSNRRKTDGQTVERPRTWITCYYA